MGIGTVMENSIARIIGARVKYYRELRALTTQQLADLTHVSIATVSRIENGEQNFSVARLIAIAEALDVPLSELFETTEDDPRLALVVRLLRDMSFAQRSDFLFILGKLLEGKIDAQSVELLIRASGLRRDSEMVT